MQSFAAQRHRINRVVNFVRANSSDQLGLHDLADVACLSKFHFSRVFDACLNETPIEHLWRVRIEHAARTLTFVGDKPITDIAMDCGFSSSQTFSRGFRQKYGMSPRDFRSLQAALAPEGSPASHRVIDWSQFPISIEKRPAYRVAYIRHTGPYGNINGSISKVFDRLGVWAKANELWEQADCVIGVCPDNKTITPSSRCVYDVSLPVPDDVTEDDFVSIQTIPGGTYAVLTAQCRPGVIYSGWLWLATTGLAQIRGQYGLRSSYEYYPKLEDNSIGPGTCVQLCQRIMDA